MREPRSFAEWLESHGNPKHAIADGENGSKVVVVDDSKSLENGITVYSFSETENPFGGPKHFWMSSGWGLRKEYLPALKKFLNDETDENAEPEYLTFEVHEWRVGDEGEYEVCIDLCLKAVSEYHASALLRDRINYGKYPKGAWLVYHLNGEKVELDAKGRIAA